MFVVDGIPVTSVSTLFRAARLAHLDVLRYSRLMLPMLVPVTQRDNMNNFSVTPAHFASVFYNQQKAVFKALQCYDKLFVFLGHLVEHSFEIGKPSLRALIALDRLLTWYCPFICDLLAPCTGVIVHPFNGISEKIQPLGEALESVHKVVIHTVSSLTSR